MVQFSSTEDIRLWTFLITANEFDASLQAKTRKYCFCDEQPDT
jgi:tRNA U38,U39,U40 pseudouridine synthase TruA